MKAIRTNFHILFAAAVLLAVYGHIQQWRATILLMNEREERKAALSDLEKAEKSLGSKIDLLRSASNHLEEVIQRLDKYAVRE